MIKHFWAKTATEQRYSVKTIAHHCADVAASALALQLVNRRRLRRDAELTGFDAAVHTDYCALLAGLHDLGKVSLSFQALSPALWPDELLGALPERVPQQLRHWESTALLLQAGTVLQALASVVGRGGLDALLVSAIAGHHGAAPKGELVTSSSWAATKHAEIGPICLEVATALTREMVALFPGLRGLEQPRDTAGFSFALNGLITLADWIGSDSAYFPFEDPDLPLDAYWPLALERAELAVRNKGLVPAVTVFAPTLERLSDQAASPRPMQKTAAALPILPEPQIVVIEDGTGSGKTEGALLLAARMMAAGLGEGVFVAMPTMATANAMHQRLKRAMGGLFQGPASLVLSHGKAQVAKELARLAGSDVGATREVFGSEVAVWFDAWVGDSRKTAFFASAGAGTIDQAFLSILPKKHLTMRQYALAGRILVVDEAHACDAYMGEELKTLVEMQARLGGSVIVLSATLGRKVREELVLAFAMGRGLHPSRAKRIRDGVRSEAYPLLTRYSASGGVAEVAVAGDPALARTVNIARIDTRDDVVAAALAAARRGAAVAIIINAVDPAIATWEALITAGADPERCHLFHARLAVEDRLAIEEKVQTWFGHASTAEARAGRILVATQVVEQSLDVDFDVMFSDLAPADLLVQRVGRLWRHRREGRPVDEPILQVLTPDPKAVDVARWLERSLGPAASVYKLAGVMWRTARDLLAKGRLDTPGDLRGLIKTAYGETTDDLPEVLRKEHEHSLGVQGGHKTLGKHNTIIPDNGYGALTAPALDEEVGTRLGAESLTLRLARREGPLVVPFCRRDGANDRLNWALSEISVRTDWFRRFAGEMETPEAVVAMLAKARSGWPEWEQNMPILLIEADGAASNDSHSGLRYDSRSGLRAAQQ